MGKEFISAPKEMAHNYVHEIYRNYYKQIDAVMISFDVNIRFFTGANVSDAILLAMRSGWCYLFVDSRYYEEASKTA
ncbi:MAG: aminopeptidase P family N-terminal domain-containing protein, partial [Oscillospiraceae bacterium]